MFPLFCVKLVFLLLVWKRGCVLSFCSNFLMLFDKISCVCKTYDPYCLSVVISIVINNFVKSLDFEAKRLQHIKVRLLRGDTAITIKFSIEWWLLAFVPNYSNLYRKVWSWNIGPSTHVIICLLSKYINIISIINVMNKNKEAHPCGWFC